LILNGFEADLIYQVVNVKRPTISDGNRCFQWNLLVVSSAMIAPKFLTRSHSLLQVRDLSRCNSSARAMSQFNIIVRVGHCLFSFNYIASNFDIRCFFCYYVCERTKNA